MASLIPWRKERNNLQSLGPTFDFPLAQLRNEFDEMFDRFFGRLPGLFGGESVMQPSWGLDMNDTGKEVVVHMEAPGFEPGDFDISVIGNTLSIQAEHKQETKKDEKGEHTYFSQRRLQRSVTLPAEVDADKVDCRYKNGILELHLPRTQQAQAKRIEVKA
jgi:HSP20 family protein